MQATAWGESFLSWFDNLERDVVGIVDAEDVGPGWEIAIVGLVIFFIPFSVYGLVASFNEVRSIHKRSMVAEGVVLASKLPEKTGDYTTVYNVEITYQFAAEGKTCTNTDTLSDMWSNDLGEHTRRLQQFSPGAKIPIHYEPGNLDNHTFRKFDERQSGAWNFLPILLVGCLYVLFSWLSGFFLTLYLKNFSGLSPDRQIITGSILAGLLIVFVFYARWFYRKGIVTAGLHFKFME